MVHIKSTDSSKMFSNLEDYNAYLDSSLGVLKNPKKDRYAFVKNDQSIQEVGKWGKIGEKFRKTFGLVNRTSKNLLEFQVVRLITCGAQNQWINDGNREKINELVQLLINDKLEVKQHVTLKALQEALENGEKFKDLKIEFNEFNRIYFEVYKDKVSNHSFSAVCNSILERIFCCFKVNQKNKKEALDKKIALEKESIAVVNFVIKNNIDLIKFKNNLEPDREKIKHLDELNDRFDEDFAAMQKIYAFDKKEREKKLELLKQRLAEENEREEKEIQDFLKQIEE